MTAGAFGDAGPLAGLSQTLSGTTSTAGSTTSSASSGTPYIVTFVAGTSAADQTAALNGVSATDVSSIAPLRMHAVTLAADTAQADADTLRANPSVKAVEADKMREAGAAPSDPAYADQWALRKIGWDNVFGSLSPSGTAKLAVLDTGV